MIKRTVKQIAQKVSHWIDVVDYYLDKGYGYIYDCILLVFILSIFGFPFGAILTDKDPQSWYQLGLYVLLAYFIADHILTNKFGTQRKRHQSRRPPEESNE